MGCTEMTDAPIGIVAEHGRGKTVLLNAAPLDYLTARRARGGGEALQEFFTWFLDSAGVGPLVQVLDRESGKPLNGWRAWAFAHGQARYFGLAPDMAVVQDTLGAMSAQAAEGVGRRVTVRLASQGHVYEVRSRRYLGQGDSVEDTLDPTSTRLYAVLPYRVEGLDLAFADGVARARLRTDGPAPGEHVFRFELLDSKGQRVLDAGANVVAPGGAADRERVREAEWRPKELPPGALSVHCRDVATGLAAECRCP
jgi:hypothetical protein